MKGAVLRILLVQSFPPLQHLLHMKSFQTPPIKGIASDNCGMVVTYQDVASGTCPIIVQRTWTITDPSGNSATCVQTITVNAPPKQLSCPTALSIAACTSQPDLVTAWNAWRDGFAFSGGCSPSTNIASIPLLPANAFCAGASLSFNSPLLMPAVRRACTSTFVWLPLLLFRLLALLLV